jgi:GTP-binding protein
VEAALGKAGAQPGCAVRIGTHEFDWQPTVYAGTDFKPSSQGTDYRIDSDIARLPAAHRKAARNARRVPGEYGPAPDRASSSGAEPTSAVGVGATTVDSSVPDDAVWEDTDDQ